MKVFVGDTVRYDGKLWLIVGSYRREGKTMVVLATKNYVFIHVPDTECVWAENEKVYLS